MGAKNVTSRGDESPRKIQLSQIVTEIEFLESKQVLEPKSPKKKCVIKLSY